MLPHRRGPARLTFPYDSVHNQPAWVKLLGEVQGSLGRVLIRLEVHIRLQPQLVLCGENREGLDTGALTAGLRRNFWGW